MNEWRFDPAEESIVIGVSSEENAPDILPALRVPAGDTQELVAVLREVVTRRATYALNAALLKWQEAPREVPGLMDRKSVEAVRAMAEGAVAALRVLEELSGEIFNDGGDDEPEPAPEPDPSGAQSA